jgi:HEAT repeat protein
MFDLLTLAGVTYSSLDFGDPLPPEMSNEERMRWILEDYDARRDFVWDVTDLDTIRRICLEAITDPAAPEEKVLGALQTFGQVGWALETKAIQDRLNDPSAAVRRAAVRALGQTADPSSIPLIEPLLDDPDRLMRRVALVALGKFADTSVLGAIDRAVAREPEVARRAENARRRIEATRAEDTDAVVAALIETDEYEDLMAGFASLRKSLQSYIADKKGPVRARSRAARLLSLGRAIGAAPFFRLRLLPGNDEREVRLECIRGLGRTRFKSAVPQLIDELQSPDEEIRQAAVVALGEIGNWHAIQPLLDLWPASGVVLRALILTSLRQICRGSGRPVLRQLVGVEGGTSPMARVLLIDNQLEMQRFPGGPEGILADAAETGNEERRRDAALVLSVFGTTAKELGLRVLSSLGPLLP